MQNKEYPSVSKEEKPHTLQIDQRKKITMTGVESVQSFSPREIQLVVSGGKLVVTGSEMKVTAFSKASGDFAAVGKIDGVRYNAAGGLKKLFR